MAANEWLPALRAVGAARPLCLAQTRGAGALPPADEVDWLVMDTAPGADFLEGMHAYEAAPRSPSAEIVRWIDSRDPERRALVLPHFVMGLARIAGRPVWGARDPHWMALEDKVVIDDFWDACGVSHAPSRVVALGDENQLERAHAELDRGLGTVWAGDARSGWHGGAVRTRWVRDRGGVARSRRELEPHCDRVRIMPFLEGIPCSIHALVFPDDEVVLRPVEMVVLRDEARGRFVYAGGATYWDPPESARDEMRALARHVARSLRGHVDYRGPFTLDGVLTEDGFQPTELNPRSGAGLVLLARAVPEIPIPLLELAARAEESWDWRARELEEHWLERADSRRAGGAWLVVPKPHAGEQMQLHPLRSQADSWIRADPEGPHEVCLSEGPSPNGSFVRCEVKEPSRFTGRPFAPVARSVLAWADHALQLGLGRLEHAREVSTGP